MRVRLKIQRHNLPSLKLLWNTQGLRPGSAASSPHVTFAQLLEEINEIVQLEGENCGLEDYTVEVHGFECLHFCTLDQLLKEDDEVVIRPLQTSDIRHRRISGRMQISTNGKHLIDGVAFGRPFLKRQIKPAAVNLSRKRQKLLQENESLETDENTTAINYDLTVLHPVHEERTEQLDYSSSEYSDGEIIADDQDCVSELKGLADEELENEISQSIIEDDDSHENLPRHKFRGLPINRPKTRAYGLGIARGDLEKSLKHQKPVSRDSGVDYDDSKWIPGADTRSANHRRVLHLRKKNKSGSDSRRSSRSSTKSVRFEQTEFETPATLRQSNLSDSSGNSSDEEFMPDGNSKSGSSNKENIEPTLESLKEPDIDTSSSGTESDSDLDSDSTSSGDSDLNSSSSDTSAQESDLSSDHISLSDNESDISSKFSDTSSSGSSGTTSSDESDDDDSGARSGSNVDLFKPKTEKSITSVSEGRSSIQPKPPGQGFTRTKKRNERRRLSLKLRKLKTEGTLDENATLADCIDWLRVQEAKKPELLKIDDELEKRRSIILNTIASIDKLKSPQSSPPKTLDSSTTRAPESSSFSTTESGNAHQALESAVPTSSSIIPGHGRSDDQLTAPDSVGISTPGASEPTQKRARLDLASSRRLLFGSLGLKTPKNKDEESKLRAKLMENVKIAPVNPRLYPTQRSEPETSPEDVSWKDAIALKAVECCYENVKLSTPPFPFVQRWDKSQRGMYRAANKKRKVHETASSSSNRLATTHVAKSQSSVANDDFNEPQVLESSALGENHPKIDFPDLPADLTTLPLLSRTDTVPGAIIVFKHLELSAETNWQPVSSSHKTAIINSVTESGDMDLILAPRDRTAKTPAFDPKTGERKYSKFEMPGMDSPDDTCMELNFAALDDPRLILPAEVPDASKIPDANDEGFERQIEPSVEPQNLNDHSAAVGQTQNGHPNGTKEYDSKAVQDLQEVGIEQHSAQAKDLADDVISSEKGTSRDNLPTAVEQKTISHSTFPETSDSIRRDISNLIRDAGFDSQVNSEITKDLHGERISPMKEYDNYSEFNGFDSSPPAVYTSHQLSQETSFVKEHFADEGGKLDSNRPKSSSIASDQSSLFQSRSPEEPTFYSQPNRALASSTKALPIKHKNIELPEASDRSLKGQPLDRNDESSELLSLDEMLTQPESYPVTRRRLASPSAGPSHVSRSGIDTENEFPCKPFGASKVERNAYPDGEQSASSQHFVKGEENSDIVLPYLEPYDQKEKISQASHIIDLTMTSDFVASPDDSVNGDSNSLPKGPGLVQKSRDSLAQGTNENVSKRTRSQV